MIGYLGDVALGGGIVVSDDAVRAAGYDPNAVRAQLTLGGGAPSGPSIAVGRMKLAPSTTTRTDCQKYDDAVKNRLPLAIQKALKTKCDASGGASVAGGAPSDDSSSGGVSPLLIAVGVVVAGGLGFLGYKALKKKRR